MTIPHGISRLSALHDYMTASGFSPHSERFENRFCFRAHPHKRACARHALMPEFFRYGLRLRPKKTVCLRFWDFFVRFYVRKSVFRDRTPPDRIFIAICLESGYKRSRSQ